MTDAKARAADVAALRALLSECVDDLDEALCYVEDYFRDKWFPTGTAKYRAALAAQPAAPEARCVWTYPRGEVCNLTLAQHFVVTNHEHVTIALTAPEAEPERCVDCDDPTCPTPTRAPR